MIVVRLVLLPFRLVVALGAAGFRAGLLVGLLPFRAWRRVSRVIGVRGYVFFLLGLAAGLLLAPWPGRDLRARLRALIDAGVVTDEELAAKVTFELAHAPRTWHLAQPSVEVRDARVSLVGTAPDAESRDELVRVAGGIPGVVGVDDRLIVGDPDA